MIHIGFIHDQSKMKLTYHSFVPQVLPSYLFTK